MNELTQTALAFVAMAHRIVWATVASFDRHGRPRSRLLHPIWQWDGTQLTGWIATSPTATKRVHLAASPSLSLNYWDPTQDLWTAECRAEWAVDDETRTMIWDLFVGKVARVRLQCVAR